VANLSVIGLGGWQNFKFLFSGGNGIIYPLLPNNRFQRDAAKSSAHLKRSVRPTMSATWSCPKCKRGFTRKNQEARVRHW
jgi:hypothetical protein